LNYWQKKWFRLINWEFWPFSIFYFPIYFYFTWLAIKARSFFFFTAANPNIDFGGMLGEKKSEIFDQIPKEYIPKTIFIKAGERAKAIDQGYKMGYPLIAKPDIGERGRLVEKISNEKALIKYVEKCPIDFMIQELVDFPIELGVFYVKRPQEQKGRVTSIVQKKLMSVVGDGKSKISALLQQNPRAMLQVDFKHSRFTSLMGQVPEEGEEVIIEPIGNHCRGTIFLDKTEEIDEKLCQAFDRLAAQVPEFYFGRFDLLCQSYNDLRELKNFKIVELNGAGAEPGHIYQPGFSLLKGYKVMFQHFKWLYEVSVQNKKRGIRHWTFKRGIATLKTSKEHNKLIERLI
jgi:hypothetical protein